jgi:hypothetical protein
VRRAVFSSAIRDGIGWAVCMAVEFSKIERESIDMAQRRRRPLEPRW